MRRLSWTLAVLLLTSCIGLRPAVADDQQDAQQAAAEAQREADIQHWQDLRAAIEAGNPANENGINGCDLMIQNLSR